LIRVRVRIRSRTGRSIETAAIANSGYGSMEPEAIIPLPLAERLVDPQVLRGAGSRDYTLAGGLLERFHVIPRELEVSVVTGDRVEGPVIADMIISSGEDEVIISDKLIESLKIALERPATGLWRFHDEPLLNVRSSVKPERWI